LNSTPLGWDNSTALTQSTFNSCLVFKCLGLVDGKLEQMIHGCKLGETPLFWLSNGTSGEIYQLQNLNTEFILMI
jgi:hypothetical protein